MTFSTLTFIAFQIILLLILAITRNETARRIEILLFSVAFYGIWDYRFLIILFVAVLISFVGGKLLYRHNQEGGKFAKVILAVSIVALLTILFFFKYFNFFVSSFCLLFGIENVRGLNIVLPIGISFYIFSAIGYLIDVYRDDVEDEVSFFVVAYYILFFPKILQGPLLKFNDFYVQLKEQHPIKAENIKQGVQIFLFGLIKKVVIADRLGLFVDAVYSIPQVFDAPTLILVIIAYPIQLYCDFSGYSDMAIGVAKTMGYDLCPNFNLPYMSKSVSEYWRRWHMSLNVWFRDYLFYSIIRSKWIGKIRKKAKRKSKVLSRILPTAIGMAIVWPLIGVWHGASFNYIIHGTMYGVMMIVGLIITENKWMLPSNRVTNLIRVLRTSFITVFAQIIFRAVDVKTVGDILFRIFTWQNGIHYIYTWALVLIPIVIVAYIITYHKNKGNSFYIIMDLDKFRYKIVFSIVLFLTIILMYVGENYFMYFQY